MGRSKEHNEIHIEDRYTDFEVDLGFTDLAKMGHDVKILVDTTLLRLDKIDLQFD